MLDQYASRLCQKEGLYDQNHLKEENLHSKVKIKEFKGNSVPLIISLHLIQQCIVDPLI